MARKKMTSAGSTTWGSGRYTQQIIRCLERVSALSGQRPYAIFDDWTRLVEATLEALPVHVAAVVKTGKWAEDTPETAEVIAQVRAHYDPDRQARVWSVFGEAFAVLLESSADGLNQEGYMGPDVIGHVYMEYANTDKSWNAQYFTPYNLARCMALMCVPDGERLVYDRIKKACLHPDNIWGQAVVLAGAMIQDPQEAWEWFMTRIIPSALPYVEPIETGDIAGVGSGVMLLALASCFPAWAVHFNLVHFAGLDVDVQCVRMARINCYLYGLNGYGLKLAAALYQAQQSAVQPVLPSQVGLQAQKNGQPPPEGETIPLILPSFEELFRRQVEEPVMT